MAAPKYDWVDIRRQFIEGVPDEDGKPQYLSLAQLSKHAKVPVQRLRQRSSAEKWFQARDEYREKLAKVTQAKRIAQFSEKAVVFDERSLDLAQEGMTLVSHRVREIAQMVEIVDARKAAILSKPLEQITEEDMEVLETAVDARELDTLAKAATSWQTLGQKASGTDITRMQIQQDINQHIDIEAEVTSISAELSRDDPERLAQFIMAVSRAGLLDDVIDAESPDTTPAITAVASVADERAS